ncbi:MAG: Rrf2 family transcriptional regulator [Candidatus Dadabacteria bacterium]|nr:Rrf2 family transcriptional regulator [Candidatus Dadabacteria bacterium]MCY4043316.1 Rrf2 family transcriptional regulator [Candidatus Dadabacteria bacterium]MCY4046630.1 Rrf2 family transcriptional regulator [Candidatus Dadabacteria bacterium]
MQVSKALDYAIRSLTHMGNNPDRRCGIREISESRHVPDKYLAKIMGRLVKSGIVRSGRGPAGGYMLARDPAELNLRDVYEAIEGEIHIIDCMNEDGPCALYQDCTQIAVWDKIQIEMLKTLQRISLESLTDKNKKRKRT